MITYIFKIKAVDLDAIVRVSTETMQQGSPVESLLTEQLSNEFQFPIASIHHAGETYLVPDLLKKTWVRPSCLYRSKLVFNTLHAYLGWNAINCPIRNTCEVSLNSWL